MGERQRRREEGRKEIMRAGRRKQREEGRDGIACAKEKSEREIDSEGGREDVCRRGETGREPELEGGSPFPWLRQQEWRG